MKTIENLYKGSVERRLMTAQQAKAILSKLTPTVDLNAVAKADYVS